MHITTNRPDFQTFQGPFRLSNQSPFSHPDDLFSRNSARPKFFFYNFDVSSKIIFQFNFCMISQFCCIFFPSLNQKFWKSEILLELGKSGFWKMKRLICKCNGGSWIRNSKSKLPRLLDPTTNPKTEFSQFYNYIFLVYLLICSSSQKRILKNFRNLSFGIGRWILWARIRIRISMKHHNCRIFSKTQLGGGSWF